MISLILIRLIIGWPTVYPEGTTVYLPEECYNGYTLIAYEVGPPDALLLDMNGEVVHRWKNIYSERSKLLPNGHLLVVIKVRTTTGRIGDWWSMIGMGILFGSIHPTIRDTMISRG